ncbi:MAG: peptidoglycan DD-metalloendopeptidase family protein [Flavobacteriaceae bacterium]|nr:peptidoglycan DD-metalloendopeptidase family protein [Flavobacteriaceae bacterium]
MNRFIPLLLILLLFSCSNDSQNSLEDTAKKVKIIREYGFILNNFYVIKDTIRSGENFGSLLSKHNVPYPEIDKIVNTIKETFDVRKLKIGQPYTILASNDSLKKAQVFIYEHDKINYSVINFKNSEVKALNTKKPIKTVLRMSTGVITSSLSETIDSEGMNYIVAHELSEIYAWTIDFFRLQKNDKFKIIYEEKFINDSIYAGMGKIVGTYFEHNGKPYYAFGFKTDSLKKYHEFYDEVGNTMRRPFLKAPLQFSRISSKYNLRRKIAFYGMVRAHRGTDFAAPVGSQIQSTADGTVIESAYKGGNGNYVKIRHNSTYTTAYLHMSKRLVRVGERVRQGQTIGLVGMTGNTSGPHVCYRFARNGNEVDPLREKMPASEPIKSEHKERYLTYIKTVKSSLDSIPFKKDKS